MVNSPRPHFLYSCTRGQCGADDPYTQTFSPPAECEASVEVFCLGTPKQNTSSVMCHFLQCAKNCSLTEVDMFIEVLN